MSMLRQSIVCRKDLGFSIGLMAAQVAHIHFERIRKMLIDKESFDFVNMTEWLKAPYVFCHGVPNLEALEHFYAKAMDEEIPVAKWHDTVYVQVSETQKIAMPNVFVGFSIGPVDSDKVRVILGDLPLLG
jgi:peptidyl-tRNA hydrolase